VLAIGLAALIPLFAPKNVWTRIVGYVLWLTAAVWSWLIATSHLEIQNAKNNWLFVCDMYPGFPSWLPLHEWFPRFFAAPGQCCEIAWQFLRISMSGWMQFIFAIFPALAIVVILARPIKLRRL